MAYDLFYYARCARDTSWRERQRELEELEATMTDKQLDAVEEHEEKKRRKEENSG